MEFFLRLSLEVLLAGIPVILLSKIKYAKLLRTIFWFIGLGSVLVPAIWVIYGAKSLVGILSVVILGQQVILSLTPTTAFLMLLISFVALLYAFYDVSSKKETEQGIKSDCVYSTLVLAGVGLSLMLENGLLYGIVYALTGYFFYKLISLKKEALSDKNSCTSFLVLQYLSVILMTAAILVITIPSGSANFTICSQAMAQFTEFKTLTWILILACFICQMLSSFKFRYNNEESLYKLPVLSMFLPAMIKLMSLGFLFKILYLSIIPARVWAEGIALFLSIALLISGIIYSVSKKPLILNLCSNLLELTILSISLVGIVYNIPIIAITPLVIVFILFINNTLTNFIASVSFEKENMLSEMVNKAGTIMSSTFVPPFCSFYAGLLFVLSVFFTLSAKSTNLVSTIVLILTTLYILTCLIKSFPKFRYLFENIKAAFKNKEFVNHNTVFGMFAFVLSLIIGIFITIPVRLAIVPASYIISGKVYRDFYFTLIICTNYAQNIFCILLAVLLIVLVTKYLILPRINLSCLKK